MNDDAPKAEFNPASVFRGMADRIERNDIAEFAGAFLVVLRDGTQISGLLVDPDDNPAMLLSNAMMKIDMELKAMEAAESRNSQFGRR